MNVYDSLFSNLDDATCRLINNMFGTNDASKISMKKVQVQAGVKTASICHCFYHLPVHGEESCDALYDQKNLRQHLNDCFEKLIMMPFPKQSLIITKYGYHLL